MTTLNQKIKTRLKHLRDEKRKLSKDYNSQIEMKKEKVRELRKKLKEEKEKRIDQSENVVTKRTVKLLNKELKRNRNEIKGLIDERTKNVKKFRKLIKKLAK